MQFIVAAWKAGVRSQAAGIKPIVAHPEKRMLGCKWGNTNPESAIRMIAKLL
jgi:hypothetical protein